MYWNRVSESPIITTCVLGNVNGRFVASVEGHAVSGWLESNLEPPHVTTHAPKLNVRHSPSPREGRVLLVRASSCRRDIFGNA